MFIPAGKLIVALIWAFWMMGVDSSLGREHNDTEEQIKKIIKVTEEDNPEYNPTYGSTLERVLDNGAETLKKESFSFVIQGHVCCTEGELDAVDRKTNKKNLSIARAKFVYDFLLEKGVSKERMSYEGLAHKFPLGGSEDKDRRVEILILPD